MRTTQGVKVGREGGVPALGVLDMGYINSDLSCSQLLTRVPRL